MEYFVEPGIVLLKNQTMHTKTKPNSFAVLLVWLAVIVVLFSVFNAYIKAKSFNAATGSKITMWQALFVDLTITGNPKQQP